MRLVIVEDCQLFRETLALLCTARLGHAVVGKTGSGMEAVEIIVREQPDVVLLDLNLPDIDGLSVAASVKAKKVDVKFLVITGCYDDHTVSCVEKSTVHGFLVKATASSEVLCQALSTIISGRMYYTRDYVNARYAQRSDPYFYGKILTQAECKILSLVGQGMSDAEIAQLLNIAARTAQTHRSNIMRKLNIHGTPKLIRYAIEHGLTRLPLQVAHDGGSIAKNNRS